MFREYDPEILDRIKKAEKEILVKFIEICEKYNLKYFVAFGTLLGTVRHKGFIPWDDDIDVGMPRYDYEVFLKVAQKECGSSYFLQTIDTDSEYHLFFAKLRMVNTIFIENTLQQSNCVSGFYIDIFPYDALANDKKMMRRQIKEAEYLGILMSMNRTKEPQIGHYGFLKSIVYKSIWRILHFGMKIFYIKDIVIWKRCLKVFEQYNNEKTDRLICFFPEAEKWIIYSDELKTLIEMPFEDIVVKVPVGYNQILKRNYGDYMRLPPENERVNHMPVRIKFLGEDELRF